MSEKRNTTRRSRQLSASRGSRIETRNEIAKMKTLELAKKVCEMLDPAIKEYIDSKLEPIIEEFRRIALTQAVADTKSTCDRSQEVSDVSGAEESGPE